MNIELRFKEWVELRRGLLSKIEEAQNLQEHYAEKLDELPPDCDTKDVKSIRKRLRELEEAEETYSKILTEIEMRKI